MAESGNIVGGVVAVSPVLANSFAPLSPSLRLTFVMTKSWNVIRRVVAVCPVLAEEMRSAQAQRSSKVKH
jgi:hypothetical protein